MSSWFAIARKLSKTQFTGLTTGKQGLGTRNGECGHRISRDTIRKLSKRDMWRERITSSFLSQTQAICRAACCKSPHSFRA